MKIFQHLVARWCAARVTQVSIVLLLWLTVVVSPSLVNAETISFQRQIRGILSDKCFQCHGPDAQHRQAGLRLDEEAAAKSVLEGGDRAIVGGDPSHSTLMARILSDDPDLKMPPASTGKSLTAEEVSLLRQWIEQGAPWESHWAFLPVQRPEVPQIESSESLNDIDRFVRHRLAELGLKPSPQAERRALIRRATLDLTGLPPTVAEVQSFVDDDSPDAWNKVVDRLLSSPHFGEQMARYWLDVARYGDTHGLHLDNYREMWAYRDWVVNAFNSNKPFDVFTTEQLAGDLLQDPTDDQLVATGFNRCHVTTSEGGSIAEEVQVRNVVDRVVTTGTVFLGLTLDCSRCHDHKFDPLTMKDFYALYGYFNNIDGPPLDGNKKDPAPVMKVFSVEQKSQLQALQSEQQAAQQKLTSWLAELKYEEPPTPAAPVAPAPEEIVWIDDSVPAGANASGNTPWEFVKAPAPVFHGQFSSVRTSQGLSQHYFDGASEKLKVAANDTLFAHVYLDPQNPPKEIMLQWNTGLWSHRAYWGENAIDWGTDNSPSRTRIGDLPELGKWVRLEVPVTALKMTAGAEINGWAFTQFDGTVYWDYAGLVHASGRPLLYDSFVAWNRDESAKPSKIHPENIRTLLAKPVEQRTDAETSQLKDYFLRDCYVHSQSTIVPLQKQIRSLGDQISAVQNSAVTTLIFREKSGDTPSYMLKRGEYDQKGDQVARNVPAVLPPIPAGLPNNRLGLAQWLTADNHPLTSRVTVNRIWQQFFGTGLVKTSEDFGSQGEPPTHPQLLDWLSAELMNPQVGGAMHRWDLKHLIRLIVTSATYRQSAVVSAEARDRDPANRFLSHGPRFRLDAEVLRDQALAVSGLLVDQMGGPSVKPPQPDGLWFAVGYSGSNTVRFRKDDGPEKVHRRTLYTFIKRTAPPPQMSTFDAPSRESCVVRRERTNSPLQALLLMNDPQYVECARAFAERSYSEAGPTPEERAAWMIEQALLRPAADHEIRGLVDDYSHYLQELSASSADAAKLIQVGELPPRGDLPAAELAAWTMVANLIMNLDEFVNN